MIGLAVPISARRRHCFGSRSVARKSVQVVTDATRAALSTPSLASSSRAPWKASVAIRIETVKPMPAIAPPPATAAQPTGGRSRPRLIRVTSQALPTTPIGLPATYPTRIPSVIGDVNAWRRNPAESGMPAFASANSGTIT